MEEYDKGYEIMQTTLILQDCGYTYESAEDMYLYIQDVIKRHNEKDSGEGDWLESLRNFIESEVIHIDDILQCDGCKKDASFYGDDYRGGDLPQLYGAEWDKNIYCNDCIPGWWAEKLESEV